MPKLSKKGLDLVPNAKHKRGIDKDRRLSIEASRIILDEVLDDINFKDSIELDEVIKDQRLKLGRKREIDTTRTFNKKELENLLENLHLFGHGVSEDQASKFLKGKDIGEDACKYFCKALGIPYFEAIEGCSQLEEIQKVVITFNHTTQHNQFRRLLQTSGTRLQLFCNITNYEEYLQLKWLLLRCFNQSCNLNNSETLSIKFQRNLSQSISEPLNFLKTKLIEQIDKEICNSLVKNIPADDKLNKVTSDWSDIAKFLQKRILFKKNIILVFYLEHWGQDIIQSFWNKLIEFLPNPRQGEHCLSLLVINNNQQSFNLKNFHTITINSSFNQEEIYNWLQENSQVKKILKLVDNNLNTTVQTIWQNSNHGQPEPLLKAIYQQFNQPWEDAEQWWHNLKS